jgi:hypothetical protein
VSGFYIKYVSFANNKRGTSSRDQITASNSQKEFFPYYAQRKRAILTDRKKYDRVRKKKKKK